MIGELKKRPFETAYARAVQAGKVPRKSYTHYFIEDEGLHSRIHLQNFYSTFWPELKAPATAHVLAFDVQGQLVASRDIEIPPFGSMFLEVSDLLGGQKVPEGSVAVDLEPAASVRDQFGALPSPERVQINTPYWMSYYDADENYMYVHSIDVLADKVAGTTKPLTWLLTRAAQGGEPWRSWRLLDVALLDEIQVVVMNNGASAATSMVAVFAADGQRLWGREVTLPPRHLKRVRVPGEAIDGWRARDRTLQVRVGLDPLMTANGKPYVIMRYGGGPLSIHHG